MKKKLSMFNGLLAALVGLLLFVCSSSVYANNVDTFGIGSKATSMGGAFSAYADDPFAVYYNPAGLVQIDSMTVSAGSSFMDPNLTAKGYTVRNNGTKEMGPAEFEDESDLLVVPHVGYAMPINSKLSMGVALYAPFGLHLKWDDTNSTDNPGAYNSYESWYTRTVVTPALAYKVNDKLSLGFGISIGRSEAGTYRNSDKLYQSTEEAIGATASYDPPHPLSGLKVTGDPVTASIEGDLTDDVNYSWNAGIMYKLTDEVTLGLTYRSRSNTDFEGDFKLTNMTSEEKAKLNKTLTLKALQAGEITQADLADGAGVDIKKYSYNAKLKDVDHPEQIQAGIKYSPNEKINIEADLVWTRWSIVENQTVEITDPDDTILELLEGKTYEKFPRNWEDTRQVKVGLEYIINDMFTARCGYFYDPSPIPDDTFDIAWADADKKTYSVGLGVNHGRWTIDGSFQYTLTEMDRTIGGESTNLNHSYFEDDGDDIKVSADAEGQIYGYSMTVSYDF